MHIRRLRRQTKHLLASVLAASLILAMPGTFPAAESDAASRAGAQTESEANAADPSAPVSDDYPYYENEWNFVDGSMDISGGIPEDAIGRLSMIRSRGKLVVVTDPYFAPQEFIDPELTGQDQYQGSDMELARLIAQRMGVELEIVELDFTEVLSSMSSGKYDLAISALSYTPGRASSMELSKGYHYTGETAAVGLILRQEDAGSITELKDLAGRSLAAQRGSLQELLVAENIKDYARFKRVASVQEVYDEVAGGLVDAAGVDIESARLYLQNNPDCGLTLMKDVQFSLEEQFQGDRIAGPKDDLELMYFVNGVIDEVLSSGQYKEWFKEASERAAELGL